MPARSPLRLAAILLAAFTLLQPSPAPAREADETAAIRKEFRKALRSEDWKVRGEAYLKLADYDGAAVVKEALDAMDREENAAVLLVGIRTLGAFESPEARAALSVALAKGRGMRKTYVLLAMARQRGDGAVPDLLKALRGKDAPLAAQAAIALGRRHAKEALPDLLGYLRHKDWQLRAAAARALASLARPPPPKPPQDATAPQRAKLPTWGPVPGFMKDPAVTKALVASLGVSNGRERGDIIVALEAIHGREFGLNLAVWKRVAAGEEVTQEDLAQRTYPPHVYGIPIYGRRVVLLFDASLRTWNPHRFGEGKRLEGLCAVPGGPPLAGKHPRTIAEFSAAHFERVVTDFPKDVKFEVLIYNSQVQAVFGKLTAANAGSRKLAIEAIEGAHVTDGIAAYDALTQALDIGGASDSAAWKKGPDEIVFVTSNMPTVGSITDADAVGAAIAMKARMRMVAIHTIGIESHPYGMLETLAAETGGTYLNYYE